MQTTVKRRIWLVTPMKSGVMGWDLPQKFKSPLKQNSEINDKNCKWKLKFYKKIDIIL